MPILKIDHFEMHYKINGEGDPILFIHGLGSSGRDWQEQIPYFANRYQTITVDVRGHGESGKPTGPYSIPLFAEDIRKLLAALETPPVHTVGISMGGMIAFQMAVSKPEMVRSLVIVNSSPEFVVRNFKERLQVWERFMIVRLLGMRGMGKVLSKRLFPKPEHEEIRRIFVDRWAENDRRAYSEAMKAIVGWSVADRIAEIRFPTLIVASDQDYTTVAHKEAYTSKIPNAKLVVIEDARHAVTAERPAEFNTILDRFIHSQAAVQ